MTSSRTREKLVDEHIYCLGQLPIGKERFGSSAQEFSDDVFSSTHASCIAIPRNFW